MVEDKSAIMAIVCIPLLLIMIYPVDAGTGRDGYIMNLMLNQMFDVNITNLTAGECLKAFNTTTWTNQACGGGGGGETTTCPNVGTGKFIIKNSTSGNCYVRSLVGSADISITNTTNTIVIDYNGTIVGESTVCNNDGGTYLLCNGGNVNIKGLTCSGGIVCSTATHSINIDRGTISDSTVCNNVGSGTFIVKNSTSGNCYIKSLKAGPIASISNTTNDITINAKEQYQSLIHVFPSTTGTTKTNLPTAYTDIYTATFDEEPTVAVLPPCDNYTQFSVFYTIDFVGAGTDQYRWVDQANNANILFEAPTISGDGTGFGASFTVPHSWCDSANHVIEMQGKSSNGTNDPIVYGYVIYVR